MARPPEPDSVPVREPNSEDPHQLAGDHQLDGAESQGTVHMFKTTGTLLRPVKVTARTAQRVSFV